jgi:hypothetical protein
LLVDLHREKKPINPKCLDIVMENIILGAQKRLTQGPENQEEAMIKPYKYFTLSNSLTEEKDEVANFYVFQKVFKGEFQVQKKKITM